MNISAEWRDAATALLHAFHLEAAADYLSKSTLIYGHAPAGNGGDADSKLEGLAEDSTAQRRVWSRDAFSADGSFLTRHVGVNPTNARSKRDVFVSILHAAVVGAVSDRMIAGGAKRREDGTVAGRVYGKDFSEMAAPILRDFPGAERPKDADGNETRFSGSKAFYLTTEASDAVENILETLPDLPFHYEAKPNTNTPSFTMIKVIGMSGQVYRVSVKVPDTGKDEAAKRKATAAAIDAHERILQDGLLFTDGELADETTIAWLEAVESVNETLRRTAEEH